MNPEDPNVKYVVAKVGEFLSASGAQNEIWAGYVTLVDEWRHHKLLGVAEGISKDVVTRLLQRKVSIFGEPVEKVVTPTSYGRMNASTQWPRRRGSS